MSNKQYIFLVTVICLFSVTFVFANTADREVYNSTYHDATSTGFEIKGAAGDPAVGRSVSSNYILDHGLVIEFGMMTLTVATSVNFGVIVPLIPSFAFSTATVDMVGAYNGYNLSVNREDATSTLNINGTSSPDVSFPDESDWNPTGSGNATSSPGNNLSFRVWQDGTTSNYDSTWWGASDASGTAKYAGFPPVMQQFMNCSSCNFGLTDTIINYRASAPVSQMTGLYNGEITITALVNP
jgi:hypothetical protein